MQKRRTAAIRLLYICLGFLAVRVAFAEGFGSTDYFGLWHTVFRATAQKSTSDTNVVVVGRSWHQTQYKALIASYLTTSGLVDNLFVGNTTSGTVGKQLYDFSGAGYDNLCNSVVYAYDGFIAGCRSMKANGLYDIYLVKFTNNGLLDTSFSTNGIKATALGGSTTHAFPRGIVYDAATGNGGENGTVVLTGQIGSYGTVFHPFVAAFSQKTGAQYGSTATISGINGTGVAIAIDTSVPNYYVASTDTSNNHNFYVSKFDSSLSSSGSPWGTAVDFTKAIGDAAADSIPSSIMINGTDVVTLGGNRVDTTAAWRCAAVAHTMSSGNLDTTFGKVPSPLVAGVNSSGISLFALSTTRDCIINSAVTPPAGTNILPVGTIYNGTNYDFLIAKLNNKGLLDTSFSTDGIVIQTSGPADDVLSSAIYLDGSNNNVYGAGRSQHSSLYFGGALAQFTTTAGTYTDNVVFSLDAAKASSERDFPGSGCLDTSFRDLSSRQNHGFLSGFASCGASSGWNGSGTGSDPYRITFDGSNDYVLAGSTGIPVGGSARTNETWFTYAGTGGALIASNKAAGQGFFLEYGDFGAWYLFSDGVNGANNISLTGAQLGTVGTWNHIVFTLDGSNNWVYYLNGVASKNGTYPVAINTAAATSVTLGTRLDWLFAWLTGSIAKASIYNKLLTASEVKALYDTQADNYRATPAGTIVRNGLILNLDAANARQGMSAFANGCAAGDLSWFDLSSLAYHGTLTNFASCGATEGWNGDGTTSISGAAGPYRLTFDGSADYVSIPSTVLGAISGDFTVSMWIYPTASLAAYRTVFDSASRHLSLWIGLGWYGIGTSSAGVTYSIPFTTSAWQQLVMTRSGTSVTIYRNAAVTSSFTDGGTISAETWILGGNPSGGGAYFGGEMASIQVYSRSLSLAEIRQNCNALKSRFSGATCN